MQVLFVHTGNESFIRMDRELLGACFAVHDLHARHKFPLGFREYLLGIRECDVVFCWFASWNSLWAVALARIFKKPSILVIGGYDLANLPEAEYGHQRSGLVKWVSRAAMRSATTLVTNSLYSQQEAQINAGIPANQIHVIYHGVPDTFGELTAEPRQQVALTVGNVEWPNLKRKGLEPFVRAASHLPDMQFVLVGTWRDDSIHHLRSIASPNVLFTGWVSDEELADYYRKSSVYVQASLHEGFGLSVAEAMLAGCIPVITDVGSLPEVVGDCGFKCTTNTPDEIAHRIVSALQASTVDRARARERILSEFPLIKRKLALAQIIYGNETVVHD